MNLQALTVPTCCWNLVQKISHLRCGSEYHNHLLEGRESRAHFNHEICCDLVVPSSIAWHAGIYNMSSRVSLLILAQYKGQVPIQDQWYTDVPGQWWPEASCMDLMVSRDLYVLKGANPASPLPFATNDNS